MKRILVVVSILAFSAIPAMVSAQGLPTLGGLPGIGGLGSLFGSTGPSGEAKPGLVAPPTFYVGYLYGDKGANFGVGTNATIAAIDGLDHTYHLDSLALGLSDAFTLSDRIAVIASGWWIVPATTTSHERYTAPGTTARRNWSAETNWWWVDALAAYNISGGFAALAGFRYDRFETRFKNPEDAFTINGLPTDEANVKSNGYIPLLGVLYTTGSGANMLSAYAVGFPTLLGRAEYHQTVGAVGLRVNAAGDYNEGYFFETRLDYKRRVMGHADLGAFFKYNATRGTFSGTISVVPRFGSTGFRGGLNRTSISVGGLLNLPFRLPFT